MVPAEERRAPCQRSWSTEGAEVGAATETVTGTESAHVGEEWEWFASASVSASVSAFPLVAKVLLHDRLR